MTILTLTTFGVHHVLGEQISERGTDGMS